MAEFIFKLRQKFSSIKYKKKVRIIRTSNELVLYYIELFLFQKNGPKDADTETTYAGSDIGKDNQLVADTTDTDVDKSRTTDENNTTSASFRGDSSNTPGSRPSYNSSASNPLPFNANEGRGDNFNDVPLEDHEDVPDTELLNDVGFSGMNFVVTHKAASEQLPAPNDSVSNPLFSGAISPPQVPEDYVLSSTDSSTED